MLLPSIDHLIGDGLVSALPLGDPSAERPQPMVPPFTTLASGLVELELPSGFTTGPTSTSIEIAGRDTVEGWTATSKGNAIWHIADIDSARLSDLVSRGDGVVAFYDLGIDVGTRYMTLWQGR